MIRLGRGNTERCFNEYGRFIDTLKGFPWRNNPSHRFTCDPWCFLKLFKLFSFRGALVDHSGLVREPSATPFSRTTTYLHVEKWNRRSQVQHCWIHVQMASYWITWLYRSREPWKGRTFQRTNIWGWWWFSSPPIPINILKNMSTCSTTKFIPSCVELCLGKLKGPGFQIRRNKHVTV